MDEIDLNFSAETHKRLVFLTNDFALPAIIIAQRHKARWRVEILFNAPPRVDQAALAN